MRMLRLLPRRRKVFFSLFDACVFRVASHIFLALTELKHLLLQKDELVTDLKNIMYCHADAVDKLTKIKADSD